MTARKQAGTRSVTFRSIVASREFARGFDEVRAGRPFNPDNDELELRARPLLRHHRAAQHATTDR